MSIATLLSQHHQVTAVDIIPEKVDMINNRKSPIQDDYIEKYLAEKELNLTATLDAKAAYADADFVVIAAPTNYDSHTQHFDTSAVEAVIKLVMEYNPNAIMVIKSTITTEAAAEILAEIEKLDIFADVKTSDFEAGVAEGSIQYIPDEVYTAFVEQVKSQSVLFGEEVNKNVAIVYSPLNGTGLKPVTRTLKEMGYTNITVVKEQEQPDGNFPTCPYPNPEIKEAMALGMEYAKKCNADLLLATDPDCDRVGIAVKNKAGEYELLTGNQTGMLLLDYICSQRVKHGKMPANPVMVKTIVTMDMGEQIATHYGLRTINVLTGFKFIGEQIGKLEKQGKADSYVFGFEESYGYLTGSYVRDKDGVDGAYMICEMFSYYATKGISLLDKLDELYKTYLLINNKFFASSEKRVIPNATEFDISEIRELLAKRENAGARNIKFAYLGTLSEQKGIRWMISSFQDLLEDAELYIAGKGSLRDYVEEQARNNKKIHFVGFLNEAQVDELLKKCDVLICPSQWQEPFGRVVLDAYKHAMPVICSDQGALPSLVDDGKTGFVIESGNQQALTAAMQHYVETEGDICKHAAMGVEKLNLYSLENQARTRRILPTPVSMTVCWSCVRRLPAQAPA